MAKANAKAKDRRKHADGSCWCGAFHSAALRAASKAAQLQMMPLRDAIKSVRTAQK